MGQEPPDYGTGDNQLNQLKELIDCSTVIEVPSADVRVVVNACNEARNGHTLHLTEVRAIPTMQDRLHAFKLSYYIDMGLISIERLVLTPSAPGGASIPGLCERVRKEPAPYSHIHGA